MTLVAGWKPNHENHVVGESHADGEFIRAIAAVRQLPAFDFTTPVNTKTSPPQPLGKSGFKEHLTGLQNFIIRGQIKRLVVVGDNDDNHQAAFEEVRRALREAGGYPTPEPQPGQVTQKGSLRVGVLMLPAAGQNGCLETLLLRAGFRNGLDMNCVQQWATCCSFPQTPRSHHDKFMLRSALAASIRNDPNISLRFIWSHAANPISPDDAAFNDACAVLRDVFVS